MDTSLTVPHRDDRLDDVFEEITEEELVTHLVQAFELLKRQKPPTGLSIAAELDAATTILCDFGMPERKPDL